MVIIILYKTNKLAKTQNFALYYGRGKAEILSRYDIAIVEPAGQSAEDIKRMRDSGTLVLAYLSVMEIADYAEEFRLLKKDDFLHINGTILRNEEYDTYMLDLRSLRWRQLLYQKVSKLSVLGYDGLFLDTIGDIENPAISSTIRDELIMAAVDILTEIKTNFSEQILVQNSGIEKLCLFTAGILDGICWENPPFGLKTNKSWIGKMLDRLEKMQQELNLKVLILIEEDSEINRISEAKKAQKRGFLFYQALKGYVEGIR